MTWDRGGSGGILISKEAMWSLYKHMNLMLVPRLDFHKRRSTFLLLTPKSKQTSLWTPLPTYPCCSLCHLWIFLLQIQWWFTSTPCWVPAGRIDTVQACIRTFVTQTNGYKHWCFAAIEALFLMTLVVHRRHIEKLTNESGYSVLMEAQILHKLPLHCRYPAPFQIYIQTPNLMSSIPPKSY